MCMLVATCSYAGACACACAAGCAGLYRCETRCGTHSLSMGHSHSPGREGNLAAVLNPANWRNYRPRLCSWSLQLPLPPLFYRPSLTLFPRPPGFLSLSRFSSYYHSALSSFRHFATLDRPFNLRFAPPRPLCFP